MVKTRPKSQLIYDILIFLNFAICYRQFIKILNRIAASLILMPKITLSALVHPSCTKVSKNEIDMDSDGGNGQIECSNINNKIANLSSSIKKRSFGGGFFRSKASLTLT